MKNKALSLEAQINQLALSYLNAQSEEDLKFLRSSEFAVAVNALKLNASSTSKEICLSALEVCGFEGYGNSGENSVSRNIRDVLSAAIMVSNERLVTVNAARLML
jgi:acyl-CoA dehydrogenase